jgi:hypothetical protein
MSLRADLTNMTGMPPASAEEVDNARLKTRVAQLERQLERMRAHLDALEADHFDAVARVIALSRLNGAQSASDVLATITEVLLNFTGVGHFALYGVDDEAALLFPLSVEGPIPAPAVQPLNSGVGSAMRSLGRAWLPRDERIVADSGLFWLPLYSLRRLVGALRLDALLPQKDDLNASDLELLSLMSEHAGQALENAWVRACAAPQPFTRRVLEELVRA